MWQLLFASILLFQQFIPPVVGYGEPDASGHPNYQERANHVFMNAVRLAPSQYKAIYMSGYSPDPSAILGTAYPARPPTYLEPKLVSAAYAHSNDMATNGCFSHNSCDNTPTFTRIKNFYTCSGTMGENIAAGMSDPLDTNNQWLCDKVGSACAADGSGSDGHRSNIMSASYKVVGTGYANTATSTYKHYWTQDFGGASCAPAPTSPIYGGSHRTKSGTTRFIAVYYTNPAVAPTSATVTIGGASSPLSLDIGAAGAGTYFFSQTAGTGCRSYYFTIGGFRYPETGCLVTYGEGTCTTSFDATCGGTASAAAASSSVASSSVASSSVASSSVASSSVASSSSAAASSSSSAAASSSTTSKSASTSTTKAPTTSTTKAPTSSTSTTKAPSTSTTKAATTAAAVTTGSGTTGASTYYLYSSSAQNGWVVNANSGATLTHSTVYNGVTGLKAVLARQSSSNSNFLLFDHTPTVTNVWTTLKFDIASTGSGSIVIFFNGCYSQTKAVTASWQTVSIPMSLLADPDTGAPPAQLGTPRQLAFWNSATSRGITLYLSNVALV